MQQKVVFNPLPHTFSFEQKGNTLQDQNWTSVVQNALSFLLRVLLARPKPRRINFLECFLLILPCVCSMTVFRLLYPLTRLQCIIHRYITYPRLSAAPRSLPSKQGLLRSALVSICQFNAP